MPSGTPRSVARAKTEINFVGPPTLLFFMQVRLTTVLSFRYPRRPGLAELIVPYEGTILAVVDDDIETGKVLVRFTWTWDWPLGISYPMQHIVSSRVSFSARLLSGVAVSQVPSVAATAGFPTPSQTLSFLASGFSTGFDSEHVSSSDHTQTWVTLEMYVTKPAGYSQNAGSSMSLL